MCGPNVCDGPKGWSRRRAGEWASLRVRGQRESAWAALGFLCNLTKTRSFFVSHVLVAQIPCQSFQFLSSRRCRSERFMRCLALNEVVDIWGYNCFELPGRPSGPNDC